MPSASSNSVKYLLVTIALIVSGSLGIQGCSKKATVQEEEQSIPTAQDADTNSASGDSDSGKALGLQTVHFAYDSFALDAEGKSVLAANAQILKDKPSTKIQIEGHCDTRGGIQYNLALGEKRANATRKYLADLGITKDRVTTISFGKERPLDPGNSEDAHAKNRRANFVITTR